MGNDKNEVNRALVAKKWQMTNGKWQMTNGKWQIKNPFNGTLKAIFYLDVLARFGLLLLARLRNT